MFILFEKMASANRNYASINYILFGHHVLAKNTQVIKSVRKFWASLPRIIHVY